LAGRKAVLLKLQIASLFDPQRYCGLSMFYRSCNATGLLLFLQTSIDISLPYLRGSFEEAAFLADRCGRYRCAGFASAPAGALVLA
jgi:hypothetical protein